MKIVLDIDGVMYKWDDTARYMLRNIYPGSPYKDAPPYEHAPNRLPDLDFPSRTWDSIEKIVGKDKWNWLWTKGVKLGLFRHGHLYPGTIEAVRELAKIGNVILCSHRPQSAMLDTCAWIAYHKFPIKGLHIEGGGKKSTSVPDADLFVDDKPSNIQDMNSSTFARALLWRRPWNENTIEYHTRGIDSWDEVIDIARRLAE